MTTKELIFPIIVFFENGDFQPYPKNKDFLLTDRSSISKGQYKNIFIVDITGNKYFVEDYHIVKPYGFLWGYHPLFKNRLFWVNLILEWKEKCKLKLLKNKILKSLKNNDLPDSVLIDMEKQIEIVNNQKTVRDLILMLNK